MEALEKFIILCKSIFRNPKKLSIKGKNLKKKMNSTILLVVVISEMQLFDLLLAIEDQMCHSPVACRYKVIGPISATI